jgi:hypothetical protein
MRLDMDMLWGRAVTEQRGASILVKSFNVKSLNPDIKARFKQLFQQKPSVSAVPTPNTLPFVAGDSRRLCAN